MASSDDPRGDSIEFRPNGTVAITLETTTYRLRRPVFDEYKKLRELMAEQGAIQTEEIEEAKKEYKVTDLKAMPVVARLRFEDAQAERTLEWVHEVFVLLSNKTEAPLVGQLPPWMSSPEFTGKLIVHWRTVPLAPSSQ